jgi:hypothetical protein
LLITTFQEGKAPSWKVIYYRASRHADLDLLGIEFAFPEESYPESVIFKPDKI